MMKDEPQMCNTATCANVMASASCMVEAIQQRSNDDNMAAMSACMKDISTNAEVCFLSTLENTYKCLSWYSKQSD